MAIFQNIPKWWRTRNWQIDNDDYFYNKPKRKETKMKNEDYVHDLSHLEANFRITGDYIIIKIGKHYHAFSEDGTLFQDSTHFNEAYTPLPRTKPHKRVKLQTVNGDDVWCDFVATHKSGVSNLMFFEGHNDRAISDNCRMVQNYHMSDATPIHPTNPIIAKIEALERKHSICDAAKRDIDEIKREIERGWAK